MLELCFIWQTFPGLQAWKVVVSQIALKDGSEEVRGGAKNRGLCSKDQAAGTSKDYYLKKTSYLRLRNLVFFYVWEDARVWAH